MIFVYVTGLPNSGTSATAGILHALGVDMGNFLQAPGVRGYRTYECRDMNRFSYYLNLPLFNSQRKVLELERYIKYRQQVTNRGRRLIGAKGSPYFLRDVKVLPDCLRVVRVERDFLETFESNVVRLNRIRRKKGFPCLTEVELYASEQELRLLWDESVRLAERVGPGRSLTVRYASLLSSPEAQTARLAEWLPLGSTSNDRLVSEAAKVVLLYDQKRSAA